MKYKLYCDLDGVLSDFEARVKLITGKPPKEQPVKDMWRSLSRDEGFYSNLDWMPNGQSLWNYIKKYNPEILTGVPLGNWAPDQKRKWVKDHLGPDVIVNTCFAREKYKKSGENHILIDDSERLSQAWVDNGGIFILHDDDNYEKTINSLKGLGL